MKKFLVFGISISIIVVLIAISLIRKYHKKQHEIQKISEMVYRIGKITVDAQKREIRFKGKVAKNEGEVLYLVYLHGYKWLEERSAIVSNAKLSDLQKAIALINWRLWDDLWVNQNNLNIPVIIKYGSKEEKAEELVISEKKQLGILDFIYLGSPAFDPIVLESTLTACDRCPLLPLEMKLIEDFKGTTTAAFKLNFDEALQRGMNVEIMLKL